MGLLDPNFVFNKRKPVPGEWEYDIHPYSQQQEYYAPLDTGGKEGLMDDWIPYESSEPIPTGDGVDPGPFFPIDDPEPLVLFQRSTGDRWLWDYGTESHYNKLLSESTPGLVGAPGEQVVDIGPPNSTILSAMGKGGGTPTDGFPSGMSPGDLATWDV
jgi:hypothetical protein